jgi:uncharacterized membrane protein
MGDPMTLGWGALRSPRAILLVASLCLNMLMGGYIAKQWVEASAPGLAMGSPPRLVRMMAGRLPSEDAGTLWRAYGVREPALRSAQADYEQALRRAVRLLAQPNMDSAALRTAVMEARDKRINMGDIVIDMFLETFPQLSPQGRRDLVGRLGDR